MCKETKNLLEIFSDESFFRDSFYYGVANNRHCRELVVFGDTRDSMAKISSNSRTDERCKCFICNYFKQGGKEAVIEVKNTMGFKGASKSTHTVALYFLGYHLRDMIVDSLREKSKEFIDSQDPSWFDFRYTWFLTALFHDYAYANESNNESLNATLQREDLKLEGFLKNVYDLEYDVYEFDFQMKTQSGNNPLYSKETIRRYFLYRKMNMGRWDHGIVGGFLLFDGLVKNYNNAWKKYRESTKCGGRREAGTYECFIWRNLVWKIEHINHFAWVAKSIIDHNIWRPQDGDEEMYLGYGLSDLVGNNNKRISMETHPLTFFLCLLDSIEPTKQIAKIYKELSGGCGHSMESRHSDVLRNISIDYNGDSKEICVKSGLEDIITGKYFNGMKGLPSWLDVRVVSDGQNCRIIL